MISITRHNHNVVMDLNDVMSWCMIIQVLLDGFCVNSHKLRVRGLNRWFHPLYFAYNFIVMKTLVEIVAFFNVHRLICSSNDKGAVFKIEVFIVLQTRYGPSKHTSPQNNPSKRNPKLKMKTSLEVLNIICPPQK